MAEDAPGWIGIGFNFFDSSGREAIADEAAVREASSQLFNPNAFNAADPHLDNAEEAVLAAARVKALHDAQDFDEPDAFNFVEGYDFFL